MLVSSKNIQRMMTFTAGFAIFLTMFIGVFVAVAEDTPDESDALLNDPVKNLARQLNSELRKLEYSDLVKDYRTKLDVLKQELVQNIIASSDDYPVLVVDDFDQLDVWVIENIVNISEDREVALEGFTLSDLEYMTSKIPSVHELYELKSQEERTTDALDLRRVEYYGWLDELKSLCRFFRDNEKEFPEFITRLAEAMGLTFEAQILEIRFGKTEVPAERDAIQKELREKLNQSLMLLIELRGEHIAQQEAVIVEAKSLLEKARTAGAPTEELEHRVRKVSDMELNIAYWKRGLTMFRNNADLIIERRMIDLELRELNAFPDSPFNW